LWEEAIGGATKLYYSFNGQAIAVRDTAGSGSLTYLHGDHLGSVGLATTTGGAIASQQEFDPWGTVRSGGIAQTSLNFTGQRLDATGLLYYHARYYDPALARFVSADTIIPGQEDNAGTANPQNLNRYSYVNNNPLRYTDATGHCPFCAALAVPLLVVSAPAWVVPVAIGVAVVATAAVVAYVAVQVVHNADTPVNPDAEAEPKAPLKAPPGTDVTDTPSQGAAKRAADRAAGIGKHGQRTPERQVPLRPGAQSPQGDPGERTEYENPENGAVVHHDPYGNYYPETDEGIGPHYGVQHPDGSEEHFTYPSKHDPRTNR
jgi:RHS repeat-associated protein